jgi:hypothetical protein
LIEIYSLKEEFIKNLYMIKSHKVGIVEERINLENSRRRLKFVIKTAENEALGYGT